MRLRTAAIAASLCLGWAGLAALTIAPCVGLAAVTTTTRSVNYTGNGVTTVYALPFRFLANADILVQVATVTKVLGVDYTLKGAGLASLGSVTFTAAPANAAAIHIERRTPAKQPTSFSTQGTFLPQVHEASFDRAAMATQDAAAPNATVDGNTLGITASGSTAARTLAARTADSVNVLDFGAIGDCSTDDTTAIQAAITAAVATSRVYFPRPGTCYKLTNKIAISKALRLEGDHTDVRQTGAGKEVFYVTASDVQIRGFKLTGLGTTYNDAERAINVLGASAASPAVRIRIEQNEMASWGGYGIVLKYVTDFFVGPRNDIHDIGYAGMMLVSTIRGTVDDNTITNVVGNAGLAYGIASTRFTNVTDDLSLDPLPTDLVISHNRIKDISLWEGLDTHGGIRVAFTANQVYNTKIGIACGEAVDNGGGGHWGPHQCNITSNVIESAKTDGSADYGIVFTGTGTGAERATGAVSGNTIRGYGNQASALSGGVYARNTLGLAVVGNHVLECSPSAVNLYHDNYGYSVDGNTIIDPWSNTVGVGEAVAVHAGNGDLNKGHVGANSFALGNKTAIAYVLTKGVRADGGANCSLTLGTNYSEATLYVKDRSPTVMKGPIFGAGIIATSASSDGVTTTYSEKVNVAAGLTSAANKLDDTTTGSHAFALTGCDPGRPCFVRFHTGASAATVTNFTGAVEGQPACLYNTDAGAITIDRSNSVLPGGANVVLAQYESICLVYSASNARWYATGLKANNS